MDDFEKMSIKSSQREIEAVQAERDSIKYKQVEYMQSHIGETFNAVISGVTDWGVYVEDVDTKAEGLVHLSNIEGDFYTSEPKSYRIIGEKTKKKYALGDSVKVELTSADLENRTLDFKFV
jgi:exoribonuclease R